MSRKILAAGDQMQIRCSKCRKITNHLIITMGLEHPVEVQCKKCLHACAYRAPVDRRAIDRKKSERNEWESLRPEMDCSRATDYSMTATYKINALVNHPVFGLGLVQRVAGPQKMAVLFADGEKIMRCL